MPLYIIGLGLGNEKDITLKGLEAIKQCDLVYLESYTSVLQCDIKDLERLFNKKIILANRSIVENDNNEILKNAKAKNVALLVVGEPLSATTHIDLFLRAKKEGIDVNVVHNASILTAIGITGLQLYKFGKTTSIPLKNGNIEAPYDILKINLKNNMHTLFLLDIDIENGVFLKINDAIEYLLKIEKIKNKMIINENTKIVACARIGSNNQIIKCDTAKNLLNFDFGMPPYCLIVPAKLHFMEEEVLQYYNMGKLI